MLLTTSWCLPVNYKLALAKSIASDWTTRAFTICLCRDWTLCCCSCWPSTSLQGVQGGMRNSVLQGIWWDRSLHCCCSVAQSWLCDPPWTAAHQPSLSFTPPGACSNSCPLSWWCHPTISTSVIPFSACIQSLDSWIFLGTDFMILILASSHI